MEYRKHLILSLFTTTFLVSTLLSAEKNTKQQEYEEWVVPQFVFSTDLNNSAEEKKNWIFLPIVFSTDASGLSAGLGAIKQGVFQPQTTFVAAVFGGLSQDITINGEPETANLSGGFISFSDYKLPNTKRLFFSFSGLKSYFPKKHYYLKGSNDSNKEDVFISSGDINFFYSTFRYVLPIGDGLQNPGGVCALQDGFAVGRHACGSGTPILSGTTSIGLKTFYQSNTFENWKAFDTWENDDLTSSPKWETNGLRLFLTHDNTDFNLNPSKGYHFELQYSKDFGWGDSLQSWDFLELKYNQYFRLDTFSFSKQNVLALSVWTGYSFSWDHNQKIAPNLNAHRPPIWEGANLGGFSRMRGYDLNRFSDKAVSYATAEYRTILKYNPFKDNRWVPFTVDWLQLVGFVEAGRVHDQYNFDLLTDMKYDIGVSLRAMIEEVPMRFDVAYGEEGTNIWLMVNHPFDF